MVGEVMRNIAIIIPARYGSTRFPGKPLAKIAGKTMLQRVVELAKSIAENFDGVRVYTTTEDQRIADHAKEIGVECLITGDCPTGSDRVLAAAKQLPERPDFILNLQGDAPLTPPQAIETMIQAYLDAPDQTSVVTPVHQLRWSALDKLRENKKTTPFSGTTAIIDETGHARWFSKNIIPAIRKENRTDEFSPIFQHMGLYGYSFKALEQFCALGQGVYEQLEGLEQLRFLENNIPIRIVKIEADKIHSGIDSPEDLARAESVLSA